jgi:hypothetical protein
VLETDICVMFDPALDLSTIVWFPVGAREPAADFRHIYSNATPLRDVVRACERAGLQRTE